MTEQKIVPHLLSEDGNRSVTVNDLCLVLGMLWYQLRPSDAKDAIPGALPFAKALKWPIDRQHELLEMYEMHVKPQD